jgi:plasmid maintenance system antidote protein VapI
MISEEGMRIRLLIYIKETYKTQKAAAKHWGVSPSQVSQMVVGFCPITQTVLDEMGYQKVKLVSYEKK